MATGLAFLGYTNTGPNIPPEFSSDVSVETTGEVTMPRTPAFLATHSVAQDNITGNNTTATVNFTTEIFDQNADYDGTNTFTAPVSGRYTFNFSINMTQGTTATLGRIQFNTSNRFYQSSSDNPTNTVGATGGWLKTMSVLADMDSGDTCVCQVVMNGIGADTADASASVTTTYFSGSLTC